MKNIAIKIIMSSLMAISAMWLSSCQDDPDIIWDIAPKVFTIELYDSDGILIDCATEAGHAIYDQINIEYDGEICTPHELDNHYPFFNAPASRALLAIFNGLYYGTTYDQTGKPDGECLWFGEFPRDDSYTITFKVNWPDGTTSEVKFKNEFSMKRGGPKIKDTLWINGDKQKSTHTISHKIDI